MQSSADDLPGAGGAHEGKFRDKPNLEPISVSPTAPARTQERSMRAITIGFGQGPPNWLLVIAAGVILALAELRGVQRAHLPAVTHWTGAQR